MSEIDLETIEQRATAATEGPWQVLFQCPEGKHHDDWDEVWIGTDDRVTIAELGERYTMAPTNAEFIAHARTDVPGLVTRVRELEAERDRLSNSLRDADNEHAEFLENLDVAFGLEDGEESRYSNPEGAAEAIYVDVAAAFRRERDAGEQALQRVRDVLAVLCHGEQAYAEHQHYCVPILAALDGPAEQEEASDA